MAYDLRMATAGFTVAASATADVVISLTASWGTPDAVIVYWGVDNYTDTAFTANFALSYGLAISGTNRCVNGYYQTLTSNTNTMRDAINNRCASILDSSGNEDGGLSLKSFAADTVTLQIDDSPSARTDGFIIAIQAAGVAVRDFDCDTGNPGTDDVNDVGFEPDALFIIGAHEAFAAANGGASLHCQLSQGWVLNKATDEYCGHTMAFEDNVSASRNAMYSCDANPAMVTNNKINQTLLGEGNFTFDASGFNVTDDGAGDGVIGSALCLDTNGASAEVVVVTAATGTDFTVAVSFVPDYVWRVGAIEVTANWNALTVNAASGSNSWGFSDEAAASPSGTGQMAMSWFCEDSQTASSADAGTLVSQSEVARVVAEDGTLFSAYDVESFGTTTTFDNTSLPGSGKEHRAVFFAEKETAAGGATADKGWYGWRHA